MKKFPALSLFLSALIVAGAVLYHAQTHQRYQIASAGTIPAVYRVDTRTGEVSVCSPLGGEAGCQSIEGLQQSVMATTADLQEQLTQSQDQFMQSAEQMVSGLMGIMNVMKEEKRSEDQSTDSAE
ncbi:MAG: hypothetical protein KA099_06605 [Alphaproteobacteria bacterium]|nr:hypothetical protein [Alphaproteobacteria bacterium]MBP7758636.1 hypothetical protein [Alphaproteobacteria bacterium]MBP7763381.1 hypothetical protein [Alphaproteobacteria bacterium]MBP7904980.1 hypothetical protein [Alphaproteobacteria bacterium]